MGKLMNNLSSAVVVAVIGGLLATGLALILVYQSQNSNTQLVSEQLPVNWHDLSTTEKVDLNPLGCHRQTQAISPKDGTCLNRLPADYLAPLQYLSHEQSVFCDPGAITHRECSMSIQVKAWDNASLLSFLETSILVDKMFARRLDTSFVCQIQFKPEFITPSKGRVIDASMHLVAIGSASNCPEIINSLPPEPQTIIVVFKGATSGTAFRMKIAPEKTITVKQTWIKDDNIINVD